MNMNEYGEVKENVSFKELTTYKIGGIAKTVVYPRNTDKLVKLIKDLNYNYMDYLIIGGGSNIIVPSTDYEGVVIKLDNINKLEIDDCTVTVGAGYFVPKLVMETVNNGLKGLEWALGIPATVGGMIVGNAGAYLSSTFDKLKSVTVIVNNELKKLDASKIKHSYRNTIFKEDKKYVIVEAEFLLEKGNYDESMSLLNDRKKRRLASQPLEYPSAGSVFRNPEGLYAGKLIEDLGLKGYSIGDAKISEKHANFIINTGSCSGEEIIELIHLIETKVNEEYGIKLVLEQEIIEW